MKITEFQEKNESKKTEMLRKIKEYKLENVKSLWYAIISKNKAVITGSKS